MVSMTDEQIRETLQKHGISVPGEELGVLCDLRWAARDNDWYVENQEGKVYWFNGKEWKYCPFGATQ